MLKLSWVLPVFVAIGCAHTQQGFYIKRGDDIYDIEISLSQKKPEETFVRGAHELCKRDGNRGFEVLAGARDHYRSGGAVYTARIRCYGGPDPFYEEKYFRTDQEFQTEKSIMGFAKGYRFRFIATDDS